MTLRETIRVLEMLQRNSREKSHRQKTAKNKIDGPVQWGTQGLLRPIPPSAFTYEPSLRIIDLAQPKHIPNPTRSLGRSAKWDVNTATMSFKMTEELNNLSKPKSRRCANSSSSNAESEKELRKGKPSEANPRVESLARAKTTPLDERLNAEYQQSLGEERERRPRPTSARIRALSQPMRREATNNLTDEQTFGVRASAISGQSECSDRVRALSYPKEAHKDFLGARSVTWTVGTAALNAKASERLKELAESKWNCNDFRDPAKQTR